MTDFGRLSDHLGYLLRITDVRLMSRVTDALSHFGLTPARATALTYVALHEGCDQMSLGAALGINRASTMKVVNELVKLNAVERRVGRDRRSNALHLTVSGAQLREQVEQVTEATDADNFSVLSEAERKILRKMLERLYRFEPDTALNSMARLRLVQGT